MEEAVSECWRRKERSSNSCFAWCCSECSVAFSWLNSASCGTTIRTIADKKLFDFVQLASEVSGLLQCVRNINKVKKRKLDDHCRTVLCKRELRRTAACSLIDWPSVPMLLQASVISASCLTDFVQTPSRRAPAATTACRPNSVKLLTSSKGLNFYCSLFLTRNRTLSLNFYLARETSLNTNKSSAWARFRQVRNSFQRLTDFFPARDLLETQSARSDGIWTCVFGLEWSVVCCRGVDVDTEADWKLLKCGSGEGRW